MEGNGAETADAGQALATAVERDAVAAVRFGTASLGAPDVALEVVREAFVEAEAALESGDAGALERARLFGAVRKKAAQRIEQRRRAPDAPKLEAHPFVEHVRPTEREALLLHYVARSSVADVAGATGADAATVQRRISRGLLFLCRLKSDVEEPAAVPEGVAARRRDAQESRQKWQTSTKQ